MNSIKKNFIPVSLFQLFSIGIGPSSSHTVGPMRASHQFVSILQSLGILENVSRVSVELFGSLAMTGHGHATDIAILLGLIGEKPELIDPDTVSAKIENIRKEGALKLLGSHFISFSVAQDLLFLKGKRLPFHSNAMKCKAYNAQGEEIFSKIFYSVGGGFVVDHEEVFSSEKKESEATAEIPYPFHTGAQLLEHCQKTGLSISEIMLANEKTWRSEEEVYEGIWHIWEVMKGCVERGCSQEGILPGGLNVARRAALLHRDLSQKKELEDPSEIFDWVSLYALAVNEENAAGGKVVTAPTNGASGIIPAVLHYYDRFTKNPTKEGIYRFFLTAAAIGILYKEGASLSAAEMGCQGEVGVACSMAAGGLVAALGGTTFQIENAAEIGMEHNLGLTCDPVGGLVQIPCIERNTMGAIKAINAYRLAMNNKTGYRVTLDQVIASMRQTGEDMNSIYKETSEGGLAIHVPVTHPAC
ncbi:MAG: L-serine ammonia-lyase [Rhabdochlamydiaceae bacterium]|nr:L-serine ammonia-lyase [Rhabdochlamydiaceae bacterium]